MFLYSVLFSCALVSDDDLQERIESLERFDLDGDGFRSEEDCDDNDPNLPVRWYKDNDGDGFGSEDDMLLDCDIPEGYVENSQDCDDTNSSIGPLDVDGDGASTCDGDCDDNDEYLNIMDVDGDGYSTCMQDCDDNNALLTPGDADGDGVTSCEGDCDDDDPILNNFDFDEDGLTSCMGDCDDTDFNMNVFDFDNDGYATCDGDCDDDNPYIHPDKLEISFDGIDQDCDGLDQSLTLPYWGLSFVQTNAQASAFMNSEENRFFSWNNVNDEIAMLYREDLTSSETWIIDSVDNPRTDIPALQGNVQKIRMISQEQGTYIAFTRDVIDDSAWYYKKHDSLIEFFNDIEDKDGLQDFTAVQTAANEVRMSYIVDSLSYETTKWDYYEITDIQDVPGVLNYYEYCDARIVTLNGYFALFAR